MSPELRTLFEPIHLIPSLSHFAWFCEEHSNLSSPIHSYSPGQV